MKNLILNIKNEGIFSIIGLVLLAAVCVTIVLLLAFHSNGNYSTDFVLGY
jgi:hypothetical protein